jgi:hypothetical protein
MDSWSLMTGSDSFFAGRGVSEGGWFKYPFSVGLTGIYKCERDDVGRRSVVLKATRRIDPVPSSLPAGKGVAPCYLAGSPLSQHLMFFLLPAASICMHGAA